jgi:hypothetical protein
MIQVKFYSRKDCHLCEQTLAELGSLQSEVPFELTLLDVDSDPKLLKVYGLEVPVVEIGPYKLKAPITRQDMLISLKAVQLRQQQDAVIDKAIEDGTYRMDAKWTGADRFTHWMSRHYLAFFNVLVMIYLGLPFLAPVLMKAGVVAPAQAIYRTYSFMCHERQGSW